ncbi:hypothetical protein BCR33DRAFT_721913 [Rhizoclosmatium globosum]|uniref:Uncharacterized protein n=1 Tax=Rhizoclosmatium globosum TaxID=329046 RepID=A0A1Y2BPP0_9FUNG|nr:hypothetical protein BCR33DRAFT_721913 [Rhizoclosmatium globosum]|eukprot:ORY36696.1 hypothetical protein BCR33DRAFT_721913 [Rhizoclosmatium globosum]
MIPRYSRIVVRQCQPLASFRFQWNPPNKHTQQHSRHPNNNTHQQSNSRNASHAFNQNRIQNPRQNSPARKITRHMTIQDFIDRKRNMNQPIIPHRIPSQLHHIPQPLQHNQILLNSPRIRKQLQTPIHLIPKKQRIKPIKHRILWPHVKFHRHEKQ